MAHTPNEWTPDLDQQLADLHAQGLSLRECCTRLGWSRGSIGTHAKALGLTWDRSQTKAATGARVADNRAIRSLIESRLYVETNEDLDRKHQPFLAFNFGGKDNTYEEHWLPCPPTADLRNLTQSATISLAHALKIAVHDSDSSHDDAKSMLTSLAAAMGMAFRTPEQVPESGIRND